jgi:hypothetical protein
MRTWVYNPHTGGKSIPFGVKVRTEQRVLDYAAKHYPGKFTRIDVRFRGALCYIDVYTEPGVPRGSTSPAGETRDNGSSGFEIPPRIFAGSATSEMKTVGASPGTPMPMKSTNPAS